MWGYNALMRNSRGGLGPLIHSSVTRPAFLNGRGTHLDLNDFVDSRIQRGIARPFSLEWEALRICRFRSCDSTSVSSSVKSGMLRVDWSSSSRYSVSMVDVLTVQAQ